MNTREALFMICAFVVSFVFTFVSTPLVTRLAYRIGAIDVPKDSRRMHKKPIPRLGGLAIVFGFLVAVLSFSMTYNKQMVATLAATFIIVVMGIVDDCKDLDAKLKFVIQILAALVVVCFGDIRINVFTNPNVLSSSPYVVLPEWLSVTLSVLWIVFITNAVNFIDGLDGLAASITTIVGIFFMLVWENSNKEEKNTILEKIKSNLN